MCAEPAPARYGRNGKMDCLEVGERNCCAILRRLNDSECSFLIHRASITQPSTAPPYIRVLFFETHLSCSSLMDNLNTAAYIINISRIYHPQPAICLCPEIDLMGFSIHSYLAHPCGTSSLLATTIRNDTVTNCISGLRQCG